MINNITEIKKLRKKYELTQKKLANLAGVSQSVIAKIESLKIDPNFSTITKISLVLENLKKNEKRAKDFMNKNVFSLEKGVIVKDAINLMVSKGISQIPIFNNNCIFGVITERNLLFAEKNEKIDKYISDDFIILQENSSLVHIKKLLVDYSIILIINKGLITGIITKSDVLRF